MVDILEIAKTDNILREELIKQTREAKTSLDVLSDVRNETANTVLDLTKQSAQLTQQNANEQLRYIANMENDLSYIRDLEAHPINALVEEFKGMFDGKSGKENAARRLQASQQDSVLADKRAGVQQTVLQAQQQVEAQRLARATGAAAKEEKDVTFVRQQLADLASQRAAVQEENLRRLNVDDESVIEKRVQEGVYTKQQWKEEMDRRDAKNDAAVMRDLAIKTQNAQAFEMSRNIAYRSLGYDEVNELVAAATKDKSGRASIGGFTFSGDELIKRQSEYASSFLVSKEQQAININAVEDSTDFAHSAAIAAGMPVTGQEDGQATMLALANSNTASPEIRQYARYAYTMWENQKTLSATDPASTLAAEKTRQAAQLVLDKMQEQEKASFSAEQKVAGTEFLNSPVGQMQNYVSAVSFLSEPLKTGSSTGSVPHDAFINTFITADKSELELDTEDLKAKGLSLKDAQMIAIATATKDNPKAFKIRTAMTKNMFDAATANLLSNVVASIGNPDLQTIAARSGNFVDLLRNIQNASEKLGMTTEDFVDKLEEAVPAFARKTFQPQGRGKYAISAIDRVYFDNNIVGQYAQAVSAASKNALAAADISPTRMRPPLYERLLFGPEGRQETKVATPRPAFLTRKWDLGFTEPGEE